MLTEQLTLTHLIMAVSFISIATILGIIVERAFLGRLKRFAERTSWEGDEIIITSIKGMVILWCIIAGIYATIAGLPFKPFISTIFQKTIVVGIIFSVSLVLARLAVGFINLHRKKAAGALPSASLFINLTRVLIFVIAGLIILQSLGISITPLLTALGVGGLAVALALQPTLSNLFAGLQIIMSKQVEPGDYVQLDTGEKGYVVDISWRNTKIREIYNNIVVVPNSKLANAIVRNYHQPQREMSLVVQVGVSYDSDLEKVERVTIDVAKRVMTEVQGAQSEFEPFIRYHTFADFSINFSVILRVKEFFDKYLIKHEFIKALHKRYKEEGIEIPFPIRTVHMKGTG